jgi:putative mRNA 3-end processing factor
VRFERWLGRTEAGLYCAPGDFYLDPVRPVPRAVVTHGHADHAIAGHGAVLATPETLEILRLRYGAQAADSLHPLAFGERVEVGGVQVSLHPAGHVLGSAQVCLQHRGLRAVYTGDFKRGPDPTCAPFEVVPADLLILEATFGLPIFHHPPPQEVIAKLRASMALFPERTHLIGAYALGKCQRLIALLRAAGFDRPIWVHGALAGMIELYRRHGFEPGEIKNATEARPSELAGALVLCPPGALADRWSRRFGEAVRGLASGFMAVRARARQRRVELPLVLSDHADWDELERTLREVGAPEVWVTHGAEEALAHHARSLGLRARTLALHGYEEDAE